MPIKEFVLASKCHKSTKQYTLFLAGYHETLEESAEAGAGPLFSTTKGPRLGGAFPAFRFDHA